ncbi:ABC transporter substrate-binding protein [Streptomyces sp. TRM43335]|uniref:ABC transporter substrate-binding protein n=1 Tax=Streptomyces taklimakanensis TaxID=2569853 RepID=A0A6G2BF03_9ACTN|nr:ABC transporter substrate-binding protein [Streptomyces taklimakanensis]MTE20838.1 ABC transporter substrate-binding protein [Streptomyces taklimakanensis]
MRSHRTRGPRAVAAALTAGALLLGGCSAGGGGGGDERGGDEPAAQRSAIEFADAEASTGPAEDVPGAREGGTLRVYQRDSYAHLDPAQIYVQDEMTLAHLIHRKLTHVKLDNDGTYSVVGDLATDSGRPSDGGRTWTYTLKDGIRFEDGSPITSEDIRHTFERLFAPFVTQGPTYVQQWMANKTGAAYRELLPDGPYEGEHLPDSVLETPDEKTIVFRFAEPRNDLPYALAMSGYAVVSAEKDTRQKYDKDPLASGPYRIDSFKPGKSMKLVRNPEWDPKTDAARHQYVDGFDITFNHQYEDSTKRLLNDSGEARTAVSFNNAVDAGSHQRVMREARDRTVSGYQVFVAQLAINTRHVEDVRVRRAIAYAFPSKPYLAPYGGPSGGELAGGLISPLLPGYRKDYDPFGKLKKPGGDPVRARELLEEAGKVGTKLTFAYRNNDEEQKASIAVADALEKAGFDVQRKELPTDTYYDLIGDVDNDYDIYVNNWGHDWSSASTVIPPLYDGREVQDGAANYSHVDDPEINSRIDEIRKIADPEKAAAEWFELSEYILEEVTPAVPIYYFKQTQIAGSQVGGLVYNNDMSNLDVTKLYVKR